MTSTFQTSYQAITVAQALQGLTQLPGDFDAAKNMPVVSINAAELLQSVGLLWSAMKEQRGFLEVVEKEMAKRKTEMEVRFQKMETDVHGMVTQESRKRQAEDDKLRGEIGLAKDEVKKIGEDLRKEAKEAQEATQRLVDRAVTSLKASVSEAHQRIGDFGTELSRLKDEMSKLRQEKDALQQGMEKSKSEAQTNFNTVCSFLGANSTLVHQAVSNGTEKEAMLKLPALQTLAQRIRLTDEKSDAAKTEAQRAASEVQQLTNNVTRLTGDVAKVEANMSAIDRMLRDAIMLGDDRLSQRIDQIERALSAQLAQLSRNLGNTQQTSQSISSLDSSEFTRKPEFEALKTAFDQLKHDVGVRVASKADQSDVNTAVAALNDVLQKLDAEIAALRAGGVGRSNSVAPPTVDLGRRGLDGEQVDLLNNLTRRVETVEQQTAQLDKTKADRAELRLALADLAKKMEAGLSELYQQMQSIKQQPVAVNVAPPQDATAGRFRCISCNRDAGPLQEQIQERISKSQFPPSPMIVSQASIQQQQGGSKPIVQSRQAVPGMREYGGGMTSSRKKLMNYYVWLQDKSDHPQPQTSSAAHSRPTSAGKSRDPTATTAVTPRSNSPGSSHPPSHPWSGAQSGNGAYGERQCGDHGSPEPDAVGIDGKYYVGVQPQPHLAIGAATGGSNNRPRSAPLQGRAPTAEPSHTPHPN